MTLLCHLCFVLMGCSVESPPAPPNILLILTDDLGYNDLGISNPGDTSHTPRLDDFARQGVRFTRHYADVLCNPSRATLLTGQSAARLGYRNRPPGLSPSTDTLPKTLQAAGYRTHFIGKWLFWTGPDPEPDKQGFDSYLGFLSPYYLTGRRHSPRFKPGLSTYIDPWLESESDYRQYNGHLTDILADNAIEKIRALRGGSPWFISYWTLAVHRPIQPAPWASEGYPDTPGGHYLALLHQLDHNIGRVLDALQDTGQSDNTLVLIVSDNGGTNMTRDNNAPLHGAKGQFLEGSTRTPLLLRWPARFQGGRVLENVISIQDIYPTLARAAGVELTASVDGRDISPLLDGQSLPVQPLFWENYQLGQYAFGILSADGLWRVATRKLQPMQFPLAKTFDPFAHPLALYDLRSDPTGSIDVAAEHPEKLAALVQQYYRWHRRVRRLQLDYTDSPEGAAQLSGDDFQRTPRSGGFTFALGLTLDPAAVEDRLSLARQREVWELSIEPGGQVNLQYRGQKLTGRLRGGRSCHSFVFSGHLMNGSNQKQPSSMALYIDGVPTQELSFEQNVAADQDGFAPTVILPGSEHPASVLSGPPLILNTAITDKTPISIGHLTAQLCPDAAPQNTAREVL